MKRGVRARDGGEEEQRRCGACLEMTLKSRAHLLSTALTTRCGGWLARFKCQIPTGYCRGIVIAQTMQSSCKVLLSAVEDVVCKECLGNVLTIAQTRCVAAQAAETDSTCFLIGTTSLRDENEVRIHKRSSAP